MQSELIGEFVFVRQNNLCLFLKATTKAMISVTASITFNNFSK